MTSAKQNMTSQEKLQRDIDTLKESIRLNWNDIQATPLSMKEKQDLRDNIAWCTEELRSLLAQLDKLI